MTQLPAKIESPHELLKHIFNELPSPSEALAPIVEEFISTGDSLIESVQKLPQDTITNMANEIKESAHKQGDRLVDEVTSIGPEQGFIPSASHIMNKIIEDSD